MVRRAWVLGLFILAGCEVPPPEPVILDQPLGQFRLGHNIAIADEVPRGELGEELSDTEIEAEIQSAIAARMRWLDGDGLYHIGTVVGGVQITKAGVPIVYARRPVITADVTVYDNDTGAPINEEPIRLTVTMSPSSSIPLVGGGNVPGPDVQLKALAAELARAIDAWLRANPDWFAEREGQVRVPFDSTVPAPKIDVTSVADLTQALAPAN